MSELPKFLNAESDERAFVVHTCYPRFVMEFSAGNREFEEIVLFDGQATSDEICPLKQQARNFFEQHLSIHAAV